MTVEIYIGNSKIDLFRDENIEVNSSVASIEDITKNQTDYSKTFTVPASNANNITFKHYYNATIDNTFDARVKVDGRIMLDGMLFKKGKFRLSKVSVKKGVPSSYTINFWGNLLSISDKLGKDELRNLDLSAYNHEFTSANVKQGLTTSLFGGDLVYNLLPKKQYYYNSNPSDTTVTDKLVNIAYGDGSGNNGVSYLDLRPSLKLIKIIEQIETQYDIVFSREFFGRAEFQNLFLWLNPSKDTKVGGDVQMVDFDGGDADYMNLTTNIGTYPCQQGVLRWELKLTVTPEAGFEDVDYTIKMYENDSVTKEVSKKGTGSLSKELKSQSGSIDIDVFYEVETNSEFSYTAELEQVQYIGFFPTDTFNTTASANNIQSEFIVSSNAPKLKLIDFLKGLFKMFKLVVIPLEDGTNYVNTFNAYYDEGTVYEITKFTNYEDVEVARGNILNEINFLYSEPETILNSTFEQNTGVAYGDAEIILRDSDGEVLDGDTLEFTLPFEQVLYERLTDQETNDSTNVQYGAIVDESIDPTNPKTHIFYNIRQTLGGSEIGFLDEFSNKSAINGSINTPSHSNTFVDANFSLLFNSEFSTWNGELIQNTLYSNYHERYISSVFNIKRRNFQYNAILPLTILLKLQLNDVLKIKNNFYRIDNFNSNLLTGAIQLNLVNSFETNFGKFNAAPLNHYVDFNAQQVSSYVTNLGNFSFNKIDNGSGVDWVTVTYDESNLYFDIEQNPTQTVRDLFIEFTDIDNLQSFIIYINQSIGVITADSNTVTADSNEITADNG